MSTARNSFIGGLGICRAGTVSAVPHAGYDRSRLCCPSCRAGRALEGRCVLSASKPESGPEALVSGFGSELCVAHGLFLL